jgi:hypothetical protein
VAGDDAVPLKPGRFTVALEQGPVGHDELELDASKPAAGTGDAFHQVISHDLAPGPLVT